MTEFHEYRCRRGDHQRAADGHHPSMARFGHQACQKRSGYCVTGIRSHYIHLSRAALGSASLQNRGFKEREITKAVLTPAIANKRPHSHSDLSFSYGS